MSAATGFFSDYSSSMPYLSHGVSDEVRNISDMARDFLKHISKASVAYGHLNKIQAAIEDAAAMALEDNWDGEDGSAVVPNTVTIAKRFVAALPSDIAIPDVYPDARGEITFEWRSGKGRIIAVSIYPNGTIGYSSLIGSSKVYGNESFVSSVPAVLVKRIAKVYQ